MARNTLVSTLLGVVFVLLAGAGTHAKVKVDFYGEALCPFCAQFLTDTVAPMFQEDFPEVMDFRYIAWGNAHNSSTEGTTCQHGPEECRENRALLCAIDSAKDQTKWFPFALCLSENHTPEAIKLCSDAAKLDYGRIEKCMAGSLGTELVVSAAEETASLFPKHTYVPWVVVNGIAIGEAHPYLRSFVCVALGSGDKPKACSIPGGEAPSLAAGTERLHMAA